MTAHSFRLIASVLLALVVATTPARAQSIDTPASHAILIEMETGAVLFEKEPDAPIPPASMSKMMTTYIIFDQIKNGSLKMTDMVKVGNEAWRRWAGSEGSLMFLGAGEQVSVEDIVRGIIVPSGNDACTVIAEHLAGTEDAFADWMNAKAAEIGMTNSRFANASGWPAPDQYVTARDLATLAERTIRDFPELYRYYAEKRFTYGKDFQTGEPITQSNRNPLLFRNDGADGLKTGHTQAAGYGLTASAEREGRRLIMVVSGLRSMAERARESSRLINYGFRNFKTYALFDAGETVSDADVWLGRDAVVPLVTPEAVKLTITRRARNGMKVVLSHDNPLPAPITAGQPLGKVTVTAPDMQDVEIPLVAGADVDRIAGFGKIGAAFSYLLFGAASGGM